MSNLLEVVHGNIIDTRTLVGASILGGVFIGVAFVLANLVRKFSRKISQHLSDVTGLRFVSALAQLLIYLLAFILYAHVVPELRALGTALLTGVSVISIVIGLAAQNTLGNLVAGFSLVIYRPFRIGDLVQLSSPKGLTTATVELISLGYTVLRDTEKNELVIPNSIMATSVVIRLERTASSSDHNAVSGN